MRYSLLALATLTGCGPASLSGDVDGDRVGGARDAVFDTFDLDLGPFGSYEFALVVITDFPDACEVVDAYSDAFDEQDCEERCEDIVQVSEDYHLGADRYWSFSMTVNVTDDDEGEFDYEPDSANIEDGEFTAVFSSWDARPLQDPSLCEEACKDGELFDADDEQGEDGLLEITRAEGDVLSGRYDVDLGGGEGVHGGFDARPCDTEDWIF